MTNIIYEKMSKYLAYDPETGVITWIKAKGSRAKVGQRAGNLNVALGYRFIMFNKCNYTEHRIAWLLATGEWPKEELDHINRNRSDNRLCNLREATRLENSLNSPQRLKNRAHGVHWSRAHNKWKVVFRVNTKDRYFGYFTNYEDACEKAEEAKQLLGISYARD